MAAGTHRVLRRQGRIRGNTGRVLDDQPLRDVLPGARHSHQQRVVRLDGLGMLSSENISWLSDLTLDERPAVGGKGGSLGELTRAGIAVPPGFVVRTSAFERVLSCLETEGQIRSRVETFDGQDLFGLTTLSHKLHARFARVRLPDDVRAEIAAAHSQLCGPDPNCPLAVGSSATTEDSEDASFAG